jgi:prepilin-type N-terminal cleavage/methylation domain-containing protein
MITRRHTQDASQSTGAAFTLIEMLTVISIIGIIAALSVPVLKNFGKANITVSASRQLLTDIGYARQLAMSQRTTVYMVFVPTNFWTLPASMGGGNNTAWLNAVNNAGLQNTLTNLLDKQLSAYNYLALGAVGDQPGRHVWHYLGQWQSLPEGTYIAPWKFYNFANPGFPYSFSDPANPNFQPSNPQFTIYPFSSANVFPFPTTNITAGLMATNGGTLPYLPYIAFNYLGQLADYSGNMLTPADRAAGQDYDVDFTGGGVDIPLAQGSMVPAIDPGSRNLLLGTPGIVENPLGNSTNITYNVVHIDALTGRATLQYHKLQ